MERKKDGERKQKRKILFVCESKRVPPRPQEMLAVIVWVAAGVVKKCCQKSVAEK